MYKRPLAALIIQVLRPRKYDTARAPEGSPESMTQKFMKSATYKDARRLAKSWVTTHFGSVRAMKTYLETSEGVWDAVDVGVE